MGGVILHTIRISLLRLSILATGILLGSVVSANPIATDVCHIKAGGAETACNAPTNNSNILSLGGSVTNHLSHGDWLVTEPICEDVIEDNNCDGLPDDPNALNYDCVVNTGNPDAICDNQICIEPIEPLVIAFINVDRITGYNPAAGDIMILQILDTDPIGDGIPSAGDTIEFGSYPTLIDPCPFGSCQGNPQAVVPFGQKSATITRVLFSDTNFDLRIDGVDTIRFLDQHFSWEDSDTRLGRISDQSGLDVISVSEIAHFFPPLPSAAVSAAQPSTGDGYFLDIIYYYQLPD
jgi:hypothetical protein